LTWVCGLLLTTIHKVGIPFDLCDVYFNWFFFQLNLVLSKRYSVDALSLTCLRDDLLVRLDSLSSVGMNVIDLPQKFHVVAFHHYGTLIGAANLGSLEMLAKRHMVWIRHLCTVAFVVKLEFKSCFVTVVKVETTQEILVAVLVTRLIIFLILH
jgi:hypothetical protein